MISPRAMRSSVGQVGGGPRLRVLFLANTLYRGGAERQLAQAAIGLARRDHEVTVGTLLPANEFATEFDDAGVTVRHVRVPDRLRSLGGFLAGRSLIREVDPDVVVGFDFHSTMLARLGGRSTGVPVVISSIRAERFGGRNREALMRHTDRLTSVTTTNSALTAASLVARKIVPAQRIVVIPNALDTAPYEEAGTTGQRARMRAQLGLAPDDFCWLAVGHLQERKDYATLARAVGRALAAGRPTRVFVAGDGSLRPQVEAAIDRAGVADRIILLGTRQDIPALLTAADALVMSSVNEGFPNAIMEALAARLPVVATDVGGVRELVDDGRTGFVVPCRDDAALDARMAELESLDPASRRAMGARGRALIDDRFAPAAVIDEWEALVVDLATCTSEGETSVRVRAK